MRLLTNQSATVNFNREITMNHIFKAACTAIVLAAVALPSFADNDSKEKKGHQTPPTHIDRDSFHTNTVPEINGAGASLALALLGGIVLIARERRKS
jgi:hypothetical protein